MELLKLNNSISSNNFVPDNQVGQLDFFGCRLKGNQVRILNRRAAVFPTTGYLTIKEPLSALADGKVVR